jgi:DtxR family Mn-dependent transcriptional regulator
MGVSPGTVTSMLKTLDQAGLATYTPYEGARLTESGRALALRIFRRHRLLECFLCKSLGLGWDEVHEDAERMEHMVSDRLIERIDEHLGHPRYDPHGDPIPAADGTFSPRAARALADCAAGTRFRLVQVTDQSPAFLRYLAESGLSLGVTASVAESRVEAGVLVIRLGDREVTLSRDAADSLMVNSSNANCNRDAGTFPAAESPISAPTLRDTPGAAH